MISRKKQNTKSKQRQKTQNKQENKKQNNPPPDQTKTMCTIAPVKQCVLDIAATEVYRCERCFTDHLLTRVRLKSSVVIIEICQISDQIISILKCLSLNRPSVRQASLHPRENFQSLSTFESNDKPPHPPSEQPVVIVI